jgi:hypothetical protein
MEDDKTRGVYTREEGGTWRRKRWEEEEEKGKRHVSGEN